MQVSPVAQPSDNERAAARRAVQPHPTAPQVERSSADGKDVPVEQRKRAEVRAQLEAAVRPSMAVRIEQRDGMPVTSVLDPETGQTLLQLPPEQVVRAIEASLARTRLGLQAEGHRS